MKSCKDCGRQLAAELFYANSNMPDGRLSRCKDCIRVRHRAARAERAKRNRAYLQQIKVERGCADCGFNSHPAALDFDHLPGVDKKYRVCTMAEMRRTAVDAEIAKCEVVCANCHRIRTIQRRNKEIEIHGE